jgi:hypothetical protein
MLAGSGDARPLAAAARHCAVSRVHCTALCSEPRQDHAPFGETNQFALRRRMSHHSDEQRSRRLFAVDEARRILDDWRFIF